MGQQQFDEKLQQNEELAELRADTSLTNSWINTKHENDVKGIFVKDNIYLYRTVFTDFSIFLRHAIHCHTRMFFCHNGIWIHASTG